MYIEVLVSSNCHFLCGHIAKLDSNVCVIQVVNNVIDVTFEQIYINFGLGQNSKLLKNRENFVGYDPRGST